LEFSQSIRLFFCIITTRRRRQEVQKGLKELRRRRKRFWLKCGDNRVRGSNYERQITEFLNTLNSAKAFGYSFVSSNEAYIKISATPQTIPSPPPPLDFVVCFPHWNLYTNKIKSNSISGGCDIICRMRGQQTERAEGGRHKHHGGVLPCRFACTAGSKRKPERARLP
jgi:hypothetical protein